MSHAEVDCHRCLCGPWRLYQDVSKTIYDNILTGYILKNDLSWQSICAQINDVKWKIWTLKPPVNFYKWHQDWTRSTLEMNWSWKCPIKNFIQYSFHFISQQKNGCSSYHLVICYIAMENPPMLLIGKPSISMGHFPYQKKPSLSQAPTRHSQLDQRRRSMNPEPGGTKRESTGQVSAASTNPTGHVF